MSSFVEDLVVNDYIVTLFSKDKCKYCELAKQYLERIKVKYNVVKINDDDLRKKLYINIDSHYDELVNSFPIMITTRQDNYTKIVDNEMYGQDKLLEASEYIGGYYDLIQYYRPVFNFKKLEEIVLNITTNLNKVIDYNYYPVPTAKKSNTLHRPIGIGVQGLANVFFKMNITFSSDEATQLNKDIFETIYYSAMKQSMIISMEREKKIKQYLETDNNNIKKRIYKELKFIEEELYRDNYLGSYSSFVGSPLHNGLFQFDLWGVKPSSRYDWKGLMNEIQKYGVRNSLLVAPMPTASTSQILGNYECFEPIISNIYLRRVLAGEYMVVNRYLIDELMKIDLWNDKMKDMIILNGGSVQNLDIPSFLKEMFKTSWEIKQKVLIDMASDRGAFICQSQSLNLFIENPNFGKLTSMHFYAWRKGLKTGIYYLRTKSASKAIQFTIDPRLSECESCSG